MNEKQMAIINEIELWRCNYERSTRRMGKNENRISD